MQAVSRFSLYPDPHPTDIGSNHNHLDVGSPSESPSASPSVPLLTRHSCTRSMGTWGEVCVYHNVCWDGESWLLLREDGATDHRAAVIRTSFDDQVWPRNWHRFLSMLGNNARFSSFFQLEGLIFPRDLAKFDPLDNLRLVKIVFFAGNSYAKAVHPVSLERNTTVTWYHGHAWRLPLHVSPPHGFTLSIFSRYSFPCSTR